MTRHRPNMHAIWLRRFQLLLACAAIAASGGVSIARSADWFVAENRVDCTRLAERWDGLIERLAAADWVRAAFVERRVFSIRRTPVELTGDLILSRAHGLSLRYDTRADARTGATSGDDAAASLVIIDDAGVLMRDANGRERRAPNDARALAAQRLLLDVLRLDFTRLEDAFDLYADGPAENWRIGLSPRTNEARRVASEIELRGSLDRVREIAIARGGGQRIAIELGEPEIGRIPDEAELAVRFRRARQEKESGQ